MDNIKFQEFYKGFKRSLSRGTILEFIKKRILTPNDIQYLECDNTLDIIDLKNKRAYILAYLDLDEYDDDYYTIKESMEKVRKVLKNNRVLGISKNKNIIFVINKNTMFYIYFDKRLHKHTVTFFANKKGKLKLDKYILAKFLTESNRIGIAKINIPFKP
jgi:hypothetical protein